MKRRPFNMAMQGVWRKDGWMDVLCTGWASIGASKQHLSPLATQCTLIA